MEKNYSINKYINALVLKNTIIVYK